MFAIILFANCSKTFAQSNFAPVGATWYHDGAFGVYRSIVTKDTLYKGKVTQKIEQDIYVRWGSMHPRLQTTRDLYVYDNDDTVFCFNDRLDAFTPLFVFNVKAGDTLQLPYFNPNDCSKSVDTNSLALSFVIDSVKNVPYDGTLLKTVYSKVLNNNRTSYGWSFGNDNIMVYAEQLGSLKTGFMPYCKGDCAMITIEGCALPGKLRCYEDDRIQVHIEDTCMNPSWVPPSLDEKTISTQIFNIYPNPSNDKISLGFEAINYQTKVIIVDAMGKKVVEKDFKKASRISIEILELKSGVYFVKLLQNGETITGTGSFIKQ